MADSPKSKVVEEVMALRSLGQTGIVKHILEAHNIGPGSPLMSAIVLRAAASVRTDSDCNKVFGFLFESINQSMHQLHGG